MAMIFKRRDSFFLDLTKPGPASAAKPETTSAVSQPAASEPVAAPEAPQPEAAPEPAAAAQAQPSPAAAAPAEAAAPAPVSSAAAGRPALTTAEAIAAELQAAQQLRPAPSLVTFAPENLNPTNAVPTPRRRAGANLGMFKGMVDEMFRS